MRRHYARYTPDMVAHVTGCSQELFLRTPVKPSLIIRVANAPERFAMPSVGRTTRPGCRSFVRLRSSRVCWAISAARVGGVLALRGHCSIQGSTDIPTPYNMLPTYLPQPNAFNPHTTLAQFLTTETVRPAGGITCRNTWSRC